jgi:hypothetical protein
MKKVTTEILTNSESRKKGNRQGGSTVAISVLGGGLLTNSGREIGAILLYHLYPHGTCEETNRTLARGGGEG